MKKSFHKKAIAAVLAGAGTLALSGAAWADITIAAVIPATGPLTQYGDMVKEGLDTAAEVYNAAGGINGEQIKVVVVDDACEPKQGPVAANRVVNDGISYVVGPVCSGATIAATPIYENEGVVMVSPSATSPDVTEGKGYHYIFRTIGRDDQQGPAAAEYIINNVKPEKLAVLHDKQSYGHGIAASVRDVAQEAGLNVIMFEGINAGDSDYSAVITKIKSEGADFVYFGGYHPEMGLLLRQAAEQGLKIKWMGPEGVGNPTINEIAGPAVEGMLLTLPADFSTNPDNEKIVQAFNDAGRDASGAFQLTAYAAAQSIMDSIKAVGNDADKVADYLHANTFDTPIGKINWNDAGDLNSFKFDIFQWHADGSKSLAE